MPVRIPSGRDRGRWAERLVVVVAVGVVVLAARPYAGSWNDGSRLATVEALVDQHTWAIDHTVFVEVPEPARGRPSPYDPGEPGLLEHGTLDKLFIDGHYYSDKSPVPALLMAGVYQVGKAATGRTARTHPEFFCRGMTLVSSGLAYVVAVWCVQRLGRRLGLARGLRAALTCSFAFATVALRYAEHVNNHILLTAVTAALALALTDRRRSRRQLVGMGLLAGLGYTIDLGAGPIILLCTALFLFTERQSARPTFRAGASPVLLFALGALPWFLLHHALNYAIGGTFRPANANPEYFRWPGSPFGAHNLTGGWVHADVGSFLLYAASMIAGKRGFVGHNLPLFLILPAVVLLWRQRREARREVLWACGCCAGTWLLYAATSNNSSGQCCTIRWFVPLLSPAYYLLALLVRHFPRYGIDLVLLSVWGMLLVLLMGEGPWMKHMAPFFWPIQAAALISWGGYRLWVRKEETGRSPTAMPACRSYATSVY